MAYASLAGMPPETALYGAWIALVLYAIFGGSRQAVVGASSAIAVMSASIIAGLMPADSAEFIALTVALALMAGLVAVLAGQFQDQAALAGVLNTLQHVCWQIRPRRRFLCHPGRNDQGGGAIGQGRGRATGQVGQLTLVNKVECATMRFLCLPQPQTCCLRSLPDHRRRATGSIARA
jgi:hypothetical protein